MAVQASLPFRVGPSGSRSKVLLVRFGKVIDNASRAGAVSPRLMAAKFAILLALGYPPNKNWCWSLLGGIVDLLKEASRADCCR